MNVIHAIADGSCCNFYDPGVEPVFECATCHRLVGWCMGCADEFPNDCDDCRAARLTEVVHALGEDETILMCVR